ncbi:hypothetical protein [Bacillus sp. FJAT-49711]|nr:hypothetical protein [Bacillus sp. FJAT-49711]
MECRKKSNAISSYLLRMPLATEIARYLVDVDGFSIGWGSWQEMY